ncbi:unnamed protein product [Phytophthora fragariaefolia]|uniref:Unnamed protein product n=1 Tax=Phytophthora fragariaefolia TaxID=1490495 RepID=A0A9W7D298_9STRA|nr:unnamed protein product [Phytophthora fragariaefolia]
MSVTHRPTIFVGAVYTSHLAPDDEELLYRLRHGQRRGWWEANAWDDNAGSVALVYGSMFHHRTRLMLDSGASTSILSLDLARRLKLKLKSRGELILNGIDGVKIRVSDQCEVMVTLGHRVVYTFDVWVGNIGQGIDCLLGMIFMVAAGVRLCANEGEVVLPDEERILLVGGQKHYRMGTTFDVATHDELWLALGELPLACLYAWMRFRGSRCLGEPGRELRHLDRARNRQGPGLRSGYEHIQVPGTSRAPHPGATLTEKGRLPVGTTFVRPGSRQYEEREHLGYENTYSRATEKRFAAEAQELERQAPPAVERPTYRTHTVIPRRPSTPGPASPHDPRVSPGIPGANTLTPDSQVRTAEGTRATATGSAPSALAADFDDKVAAKTTDFPAESRGASTPPARAAQELERVFGDSSLLPVMSPLTTRYVMLAAAERNPEGEPAVYYHQGSDFILLDQPKNQLAYLPDLSDLTNEAKIDDAVVSDPGITTRKFSLHHPS